MYGFAWRNPLPDATTSGRVTGEALGQWGNNSTTKATTKKRNGGEGNVSIYIIGGVSMKGALSICEILVNRQRW
jgi:hypothetical protein